MKVAVSLQQIVSITKEMDVPDSVIKNHSIQFPLLPQDKPVVKNIIDVFAEDGNLLFSIGRDVNGD